MKDKQAKYPQLRFKGFTDPWVQRNLGEWSDVRDGTHASPKYIEQGHPMVTSKNLTDSGLDMSDVYYLTDEDFNEINQRSKVDIGDILFGMIGTIGKPVIVDRDDFAIKNVALIKEKTSPEIINTWLIQYLKSPSFERFIQKENAGGTQKFIALGLIRDMKLMTPSVQEQARIGELLNHLDKLIAANQRKLDLLKELKQGYLQKLFPKNGSKFPQLRFAGFADAWEQRKLGELGNVTTGKAFSSNEFNQKGEYLVITNKDISDSSRSQNVLPDRINVSDEKLINKYNLSVNNILVTMDGVNLGKTAKFSNDKALLAQRVGRIQSNQLEFIYQVTASPEFVLTMRTLSVGNAIKHISLQQISNYTSFVPNSKAEQQKIGSFFKQLDSTIALHQRKLDLLKEQKKGFLQKMFV